MAVLCIAGSGSGAGKTAVGCELIRAMPELRWLAVKITAHEHSGFEGITEETDAGSAKDTGRYRAAGAVRAFLVTTKSDVPAFIERVRARAPECDAVLIETGKLNAAAIAVAGEGNLTLAVLAADVSEWKSETRMRAGNADALVLANGMALDSLPDELRRKVAFALPKWEWQSAALVDFARKRLKPAHL